MKKILRYVGLIGIIIILLSALIVFGMSNRKLTRCEDEPNHFIDEGGNGYCIAEGLVSDIKNTADTSENDKATQ